MPRPKPELTWFKPRLCWKKKHKGRVYYFGTGKCKSKGDKEGYRAALAEYTDWLKERPADQTPGDRAKQLAEARERLKGSPQWLLDAIEAEGREVYPQASDVTQAIDKAVALGGRLDDASNRLTLVGKAYIEGKRLALSSNGKSEGGLSNHSKAIAAMVEALGDISVASINETSLTTFYQWLVGQISEERYKPATAFSRWVQAKQFINWCWQQRRLKNIPRNINNTSDFVFNIPAAEPEPFSLDQLGELFTTTNKLLRLVFLLGLNCGFTQKDCSDLLWEQIDLKKGFISRPRSKTKNRGAPTISYKLWPETIDALQGFKPKASGSVVTSRKGNALVFTGMSNKETQKYRYIDLIGSQYNTAFPSSKKDGKRKNYFVSPKGKNMTLKNLRKTGPSFLESHNEYQHVVTHYLGHKGQSTAKRFYVVPSQERFDASINWLREQFLAILPKKQP